MGLIISQIAHPHIDTIERAGRPKRYGKSARRISNGSGAAIYVQDVGRGQGNPSGVRYPTRKDIERRSRGWNERRGVRTVGYNGIDGRTYPFVGQTAW